MADTATSTLTISAPPERVLAVIADIAGYPEWTGQIKSAEVLERDAQDRPAQARFVMDAGALRDEYVLAYVWSATGVTWRLVSPSTVQKSQIGAYRLVPVGADTEVTYELAVDLSLPMLGMFKRKAEKMIMDSALKALKKRVEQPATGTTTAGS